MLPGAAARASEPRHRRTLACAAVVLAVGVLILGYALAGREDRVLREVPAPGPAATPRAAILPGTGARAGCLDCHPTIAAALARGPGRPGHQRSQSDATMPGTTACEACHGPGEAHAESARLGSRPLPLPFGPGRSLPGEEVRMCGHCHGGREGTAAVPTPDPHPLNLIASACYRGSEGRLTCTSCHDPHGSDGEDRARYERVCLDCHRPGASRPEQVACPVAPRSGCIECHLPMAPASGNRMLTDHRIRVHPGRGRPAGFDPGRKE